MDHIRAHLDDNLRELIDKITDPDIDETTSAAAMKQYQVLSNSRPLLVPEPDPEPIYVPTTRWQKVKAGTAAVWDNETTRVLLKVAGPFSGVALVVWSTIHRDHVLDKQAVAQANQRSS